MKHLFGLLIIILFFSAIAQAEELEINVTKISENLYQLEGKAILLQTLDCDETTENQDPALQINDTSKKIIFRESEATCDVLAAYKLSGGGVGSYAVTIRSKLKNWYAISSTKSYIKTKKCPRLDALQKAVLSLSGTGFGSLHIAQTECLVEGVYTKLD